MRITPTDLPGVILFEPKVHGDERGFFVETFRQEVFAEAGIADPFVQDNHSRSRRGVLRGLHYQLEQPQGKLVRCVRGEIFDVAVDVRRGSPTFGRWTGTMLDDRLHKQLYIPPGFAHGLVVLSEYADVVYKCTDYYHPASERGVAWNDPELAIDWRLGEVMLSAKDQANPRLKDQDALPSYEPVAEPAI
jgi:dTDP-4-dehydrorhamnose 3,5-epimerase